MKYSLKDFMQMVEPIIIKHLEETKSKEDKDYAHGVLANMRKEMEVEDSAPLTYKVSFIDEEIL